jgi:hypothetical protein
MREKDMKTFYIKRNGRDWCVTDGQGRKVGFQFSGYKYQGSVYEFSSRAAALKALRVAFPGARAVR